MSEDEYDEDDDNEVENRYQVDYIDNNNILESDSGSSSDNNESIEGNSSDFDSNDEENSHNSQSDEESSDYYTVQTHINKRPTYCNSDGDDDDKIIETESRQ
ncbi:hypothetical protein H4219_006301 [Mycoemilia scoparia]|uniref:Uncharacterized protein n=1 Tax=Mycoemilia scoparia TaxID=417184 RepID=A0A9W8DJ25_9FUNG|nr:hypothetical protein H4219_006301 [Mycoemilia scoparia]